MPTQELPYLALGPGAFGAVSEKDAEQAVVDAIPTAVKRLGAPASPPNTLLTPEATRRYQESRVDADPSIYFSRTRVDLETGKVPNTEFGRPI
jgi:hypothetical protein